MTDAKVNEIVEFKSQVIDKTNQITDQAFDIISQCKKNTEMTKVFVSAKEEYADSLLDRTNQMVEKFNKRLVKEEELLENCLQ